MQNAGIMQEGRELTDTVVDDYLPVKQRKFKKGLIVDGESKIAKPNATP